MKVKDIVVGGVYSNNKEGRFEGVRKVLAEGAEFKLYKGVQDEDNVKYEVVKGKNQGKEFCMTRISFAQWAKMRVDNQ